MATTLAKDDITISVGVFEALKAQKNNSEFSDLVVIAGSTEFHCHRVIMSAVSGFFRGLLASGMKEAGEGKVTLKSLSEDAFSSLLTCVYTGRSVVTVQNLFDIWAAADLLEVGFLLKHCKEFFTKSLAMDNCFHFCVSVRLLDEEAKLKALDFVVANFESLRFTDHFAELTFEEMKYIVKSEVLAAPSEDDVIEVILRWIDVKHGKLSDVNPTEEEFSSKEMSEDAPSSKGDTDIECKVGSGDTASVKSSLKSEEKTVSSSEILFELLECSRYLLISHNFLMHTLENHELVQADSRCQALVRKIYRYTAQNDLHQEWCPTDAVHRQSSPWKNVLIQFEPSRNIAEIRCLNVSSLEIKYTSTNLSTGLQLYTLITGIIYQDGCLYALKHDQICVYSPLSQSWIKVSVNINEQGSFILIGQALYMFQQNVQDKVTMVSKVRLHDRVNQRPISVKLQPVCQIMVEGNMQVKGATSIGNRLIVFLAGDQGKSFTVECYDLARRKSVVMEDQLGSRTDLVTFRKDNEAFALQENGALWRIRICSSTDQLVFTQELQLWDGTVTLIGALLFDTQLIISGNDSNKVIPSLTNVSLHSVFDKINFIDNVYDKKVRLIHAVLPKNILC